MTTIRNVDVDLDDDPDTWPFEAVLAMLERGSVSQWRRLAAAIMRSPWGPCAQAVATAISWEEIYGVDRLFDGVLHEAREQFDERSRRRYGERIRAVRRSLGLSQREFAALIGSSAPRLSSYERGRVAPSVELLGRIEAVAEPPSAAPGSEKPGRR